MQARTDYVKVLTGRKTGATSFRPTNADNVCLKLITKGWPSEEHDKLCTWLFNTDTIVLVVYLFLCDAFDRRVGDPLICLHQWTSFSCARYVGNVT
jgi:hypothetical protein